MAFQDLREFLAFLEQRGELRRVTAPVTANLEITEIADRVVKAGGPALYFEHVSGYEMPVVINLFGSERRMAWALGVESLDELGERVKKWIDLAQGGPPEGLIEKLKLAPEAAELLRSIRPHTVGHAPCQEVVHADKPSLASIPILQCWPKDGGRYLTLTMCHSKDPVTGKRNIGMYRCQVYDERTIGMHWQIHKGGAAHFHEAARLGEEQRRMEVAVVIGADPASIYAASAPLPPGVDELVFAGFRAASRSRSCSARPSTSACRHMPRSSSKATSIPTSCARKGRLATTPATTPPSSRIR